MNCEIKNAKVESTRLTVEDHGVLSAWLHLDYGGSSQGFGGYCLDEPDRAAAKYSGRRRGHPFGSSFIRGILDALKVGCWEELPDTPLRVKCEPGWGGKIIAIGHYIEDRWYCPATDAERYETEPVEHKSWGSDNAQPGATPEERADG